MRIAGNVDRPLRIITQSSSLSFRRLGQSGITYIGLLLAIVLIGIATAGLTPMWHTMVQRDREAELLFRLGEFRRAIARYRQDHGRYPARLKDLLEDKTQLQVRRYLRRIYTDPMSRAADWTLEIIVDKTGTVAGIRDVHSQSNAEGFRIVPDKGNRYSEW
jgi:type II secretory pathway pseudopilin PulG